MAKLLLVDDSMITLRKEKHIIEGVGEHECTLALDGILGLEVFDKNSDFDLIVSDVHMPNMDGMEFIQEIRKRNKSIPIIICTADTQESTQKKAIEFGANFVINKPDLFDEEKAKAVLKKVLGA